MKHFGAFACLFLALMTMAFAASYSTDFYPTGYDKRTFQMFQPAYYFNDGVAMQGFFGTIKYYSLKNNGNLGATCNLTDDNGTLIMSQYLAAAGTYLNRTMSGSINYGAINLSCYPNTTGLSATPASWWKLDNGTAPTADTDVQGVADLTISGGSRIGAKVLNGMRMVGGASYLYANNSSSTSMVNNFTVALWVSPENASNNTYIFSKGPISTTAQKTIFARIDYNGTVSRINVTVYNVSAALSNYNDTALVNASGTRIITATSPLASQDYNITLTVNTTNMTGITATCSINGHLLGLLSENATVFSVAQTMLAASNNITFTANTTGRNVTNVTLGYYGDQAKSVGYNMPTAFNGSNWAHIAVTYNKTLLALYVDGALAINTTYTTSNTQLSSGPLVFADSTTSTGNMAGIVDDIYTFTSAISAADVAFLYNATRTLNVNGAIVALR